MGRRRADTGTRDPAPRGAGRRRDLQRVYSRLFSLWERDVRVDSRDDATPVDSAARGAFRKMTKTQTGLVDALYVPLERELSGWRPWGGLHL
jgi:hypothetical protein